MNTLETEQDLLSLIKSFETESDLFDYETDIQSSMEHYLGKPNGREREGYSKVVTREVLETVETVVPYLMKLFFSGDEVVRFEPEGEEDIDQAQQETDYVNWVFLRKNKGFSIGETAIRDALLHRFGVSKLYYEQTEKKQRSVFHNKSMEELAMIAESPDVEIIETSEVTDGSGNPTGLYDVVILEGRPDGCVRIESIPPEEFRINAGAKDIDTAKYCAHVTTMTKSAIEDLGFEIDDQLAGNDQPSHQLISRSRGQGRDYRPESTFVTGESHDGSLKEYTIHESYVRADWDGDGYAELRQVVHVGDQVLSNEEVDSIPFVGWSPIMIAHRLEGLSLTDLTKDIQLIKTTITRNMLDNQYLANNGRYKVMEGMVNLDDLLNSKPGGFVRVKSHAALEQLPTPQLSQQSFAMLQVLDQGLERRTGVSDRLRGVDPNMLAANQAASAVSQVLTSAEQRLEMIARRFGEDYLVPSFRKIHNLSIKHESGEKKFRLRDKFTAVNPADWNDRYDMRVVVGLGNGNKTERLFHLQQLFAAQQAIIQGGGLGVLVTPKNIWALQEDIVQLVDKTARSRYFADPGDIKGNEPPEGPSIQEQLAVQEQARKDKETEANILARSKELNLKQEELELERDKVEINAKLKKEELHLEALLEHEQKRGVALG